ncbi:MAG: hypothetical protein R3253_15335, partial [Longimicrobiales bacterium]|nr:hypothetical protein [Longimicrobiales bacterium]
MTGDGGGAELTIDNARAVWMIMVGGTLLYTVVAYYLLYAEIVQVADRLLARGYTDDDVRNILGENFLRV